MQFDRDCGVKDSGVGSLFFFLDTILHLKLMFFSWLFLGTSLRAVHSRHKIPTQTI